MEISSWLLRLERRFGRWGIAHLIKGLVILNCLIFVLQYPQPGFAQMLNFDADAITAGEFWRLFTFLLSPSSAFTTWGIFFFALAMWFSWFIAEGLEQALGPFLVNFYLLLGWLLTVLLGFWLYPNETTNIYIMQSLFFAFATFYPDTVIMLFFVLPVKIKYLAYFSACMTLITCIIDPFSIPMVLAGTAGYIVFFMPGFISHLKMRADSKRRMKKFRGED